MKKYVLLAVLFGLAGNLLADVSAEAMSTVDSLVFKKQQEVCQADYRQEAPKPEISCEDGRWFLLRLEGFGEDWRMMCQDGIAQQPTEYFKKVLPVKYVGLTGSLKEEENTPPQEIRSINYPGVPDFFDDNVTNFLHSCSAPMQAIVKKKLLDPRDKAVEEILKRAVELYNKNHPGEPQMQIPSMQRGYASIANLIHAIYIVHKYSGENQFSANAVCMLGKTIGAASRDRRISAGDSNRKNLSNMFGAFAAYMGADSIYFPGAYTQIGDKVKEDLRFGPTRNRIYDYYWEDYNDLEAYKEVLKLGPWAFDTLKEIADAVNFTADESADFNTNRQNYWKAYSSVFTGKGTCGLREDATVDYYKLIEYLAILCAHDLVPSMKPSHHVSDVARAAFVSQQQKQQR